MIRNGKYVWICTKPNQMRRRQFRWKVISARCMGECWDYVTHRKRKTLKTSNKKESSPLKLHRNIVWLTRSLLDATTNPMTLKKVIDFKTKKSPATSLCWFEMRRLEYWIDKWLLNKISVSTRADHENLCQIFSVVSNYLKRNLQIDLRKVGRPEMLWLESSRRNFPNFSKFISLMEKLDDFLQLQSC